MGRSVAQPVRINIATAIVGEAKADAVEEAPLLMAEVGAPQRTFDAADHVPAVESAQSDNEVASSLAEPLHVVASVPNQQEGVLEVNVPTAVVATVLMSAAGERSDADRASSTHPEIVALARVSSESTATVTSSKSVRWSLDDDTPLADPVALFDAELLTDDSLRKVAERWQTQSSPLVAAASKSGSQELNLAISKSKLSWRAMYEMGRLAATMDGPAERLPFFRAAVLSEAWSFTDESPSPRDTRVMEILAGTFVWVQRDDELAGKALMSLMQWEKRTDSSSLRQVTLAYGDVLDRSNMAREQDVIEPLRNILADGTDLSQADQLEIRWALGRALLRLGRFAQGATELSAVTRASATYAFTEHAAVLLTIALAKSGDLVSARKAHESWIARFQQSKADSDDPEVVRDVEIANSLLQ